MKTVRGSGKGYTPQKREISFKTTLSSSEGFERPRFHYNCNIPVPDLQPTISQNPYGGRLHHEHVLTRKTYDHPPTMNASLAITPTHRRATRQPKQYQVDSRQHKEWRQNQYAPGRH